ncbi:MAG: metallophosphoesterase family protein [Anaerolineae bacterium]|nr:metallophosphoesterase family protein [Anaerolineae bacterium]
MKIGIIADTHDDIDNLKAALAMLQAEGVTTILHCGDVCGPHMIRALLGFDVWIVQGNMDSDSKLTAAVEEAFGQGRLAWLQRLALDGTSVAMLHGDNEEALQNLIASGEYAYVLHGHTHKPRDQMVGRTRVINPGALGGTRPQRYSFCILDLATGEPRFFEL